MFLLVCCSVVALLLVSFYAYKMLNKKPAPSLQPKLLRSSFQIVAQNSDEFARAFYNNMFTDFPEVHKFFEKTDFVKQRVMLVKALTHIVENVENPDKLLPALRSLGARHNKYQTEPEHYPIVGASLIKTMGQFLKADFTSEVKQAWVDAYDVISKIMIDAAQEAKQNTTQ